MYKRKHYQYAEYDAISTHNEPTVNIYNTQQYTVYIGTHNICILKLYTLRTSGCTSGCVKNNDILNTLLYINTFSVNLLLIGLLGGGGS